MTGIGTVELGTTGEEVSALGLGCMGMGTQIDDEASFALLDRYAEDGGGFLDTADCYAWFYARGSSGGESEEVIGRWLARRGRRDDVFIATKGSGVVLNPDEMWPADRAEADWSKARFVGAGAGALRTALEGSLQRLGVDHIDLYYVHVDDVGTPLEETLAALAGFVQEGKVRHLGWSNVRTDRLRAIHDLCVANGWPEPVAVQQAHSYLPPREGSGSVSVPDGEQLAHLAGRPDQILVAYSPLLKGMYDLPGTERLGHPVLRDYAGPTAIRRLAALDDVAARTGHRPGQVVLAWLLAQRSPRVIPLLGTTRLTRYREAVAALDLRLTDEQVDLLSKA